VPYGGAQSNGELNKGIGNNMAVQPDGKLVVCMDKSNPNGTDLFLYTYRYLPDGSPDPDFGINGVSKLFVGDQCKAYDLQLEPDGRITIIGESEYCVNGICGAPQFIMLRLLPNGDLDASFGVNGHITTTEVFGALGTFAIPYRVRRLANGKYFIGGRGINGKPFVARLLATGFPDPTFAVNGVYSDATQYGYFADLGVDANGACFALFRVYNYQGGNPVEANLSDLYVRKFTSSGALDATFGNAGVFLGDFVNADIPTSITFTPSNDLLITGQDYIAFVNASGTLSSSVPNGFRTIAIPSAGTVFLNKLVVVGAGRYLLCGKVHQEVGGNFQEKALVAQVDASGQFIPAFNGTGYLLLDHGSVGATGWNGKLCRLHDLDIASNGVVFGSGYRNPIAGNTLRALYLIKLIDVPMQGSGVGVLEHEAVDVLAFPNPTDGAVQINIAVSAHYTVSSADGRIVAQGRWAPGVRTLDLSPWPVGIYTVQLQTPEGEALGVSRVSRQ